MTPVLSPEPCPAWKLPPLLLYMMQFLKEKGDKHGFEPGKIDGIWGPQTKIAVKAYQGTYKLGNDGIVGKSTWAMMGTGKNCYR